MESKHAPRQVVILAYEGMNLLDLSGPLQVLATTNRLQGREAYRLHVASAQGGAIVTSAGLPVMTQSLAALDALLAGQELHTLISPGGSLGEPFSLDLALVAWIRRMAPRAQRVCSVCTGAFHLAEAGVLDGLRVTTHWDSAEQLQRRYPALEVDGDPIYIRQGRIWTSAGVTAGIDLALALVEQDLGHACAIATARQLVVFVKRPGGQSQFSTPLASQATGAGRFAELHAWIAAHLEADLRVENLARQANMSPRTFARLYVAETGRTPARAVELMRLEAARRALEETRLPLKRIASQAGYGEEQNLRRVFLRQLGVSPGQYRERFATPAVAQVSA
ncbi:GlxA family transcriptional regulator [Herbaspirillum sp. AP02]|uniref:GlxA family transcriptional regulator n=1 Tax=unclassified Herbaspirillum TaxID=2624150 RepID=UPI0015D9CF92|nr:MULTISPECIES: GlxA family transcriptional regulator [unclassified Herbaspirillum]MBG7617888.1 GlxA family transcriptional regulator [Herbaspirillum sp. AP02]NZD70075.1 GlxA family transcriptional regulator [Herbaspirillum sp. AP21]